MPNFVCDICGGSIKMQANKTGICQNCGMEYDIDAIRAMAGNTAAKPASAPAPAPSIKNDELDRDALLIYLNDLRTMETMLYKSQKTNENIEAKYDKRSKEIVSLRETKKSEKLESVPEYKSWIHIYLNPLIAIGVLLVLVTLSFVGNDPTGLIFTLPLLFITILWKVILTKMERKDYERRVEDQERNLRSIKAHNSRVDDEIKEKNKIFSKWKSEANSLKNEMQTEDEATRAMLDKAYSLNLIPLQFRTIEGVYYLYDYLSTSNQSLSEALMQANLEAIKQKLNEVIKNQSAQIVLQAQTNAKLDEIKAKNQEILETAQATMNNTAIAAKYAQITAINTEMIAKLSAKQLAYQRAEFWLN